MKNLCFVVFVVFFWVSDELASSIHDLIFKLDFFQTLCSGYEDVAVISIATTDLNPVTINENAEYTMIYICSYLSNICRIITTLTGNDSFGSIADSFGTLIMKINSMICDY